MESDVVGKTEEVETRVPRQEELLNEWGLGTGDIKQCIEALNKLVDDTPKFDDLVSLFEHQFESKEPLFQSMVVSLEQMLKQTCGLLQENNIELPPAINLWWEATKENAEKIAVEAEREAEGIKKAIENGACGGFVRRANPEGETNDTE